MVNYEQKYKGLVQKLKNAKEIKGGYTFKSVLDEVAPELQESNNENVRKEIINYLEINSNQMTPKQFSDFRERWLPWLEKQGEQKADDDVIEEMVSKYRNNPIKDNESFGKPVNCMVDAYRQGLTDAISTFKLENKPSDWSEDDEKRISSILWSVEYCKEQYPNLREYQCDIDWLKSLKKRYTWIINGQ